MEKFIAYEKLSKKKQRELNASRRTTWALNPVTRKPANPKAYNRKTARNWKDDSNSVPCFLICKSLKQHCYLTCIGYFFNTCSMSFIELSSIRAWHFTRSQREH